VTESLPRSSEPYTGVERAVAQLELPRVSVIIAAYNEQKWIQETILSVMNSGFPCELIVVDDGSTDGTARILEPYSAKVKIITHQSNYGKGAAIASGLQNASGEIVVFCDAHLRGLTRYHLLSLVLPLIHGSAREVLGLEVPVGLFFAPFFFPGVIFTGQRAYFRNDLLPIAEAFEELGYGIEAFLYTISRREQKAVVLLPGLVHLWKKDTSSFSVALSAYTKEVIEVVGAIISIKSSRWADLIFRRKSIRTYKARSTGRRRYAGDRAAAMEELAGGAGGKEACFLHHPACGAGMIA